MFFIESFHLYSFIQQFFNSVSIFRSKQTIHLFFATVVNILPHVLLVITYIIAQQQLMSSQLFLCWNNVQSYLLLCDLHTTFFHNSADKHS